MDGQRRMYTSFSTGTFKESFRNSSFTSSIARNRDKSPTGSQFRLRPSRHVDGQRRMNTSFLTIKFNESSRNEFRV